MFNKLAYIINIELGRNVFKGTISSDFVKFSQTIPSGAQIFGKVNRDSLKEFKNIQYKKY